MELQHPQEEAHQLAVDVLLLRMNNEIRTILILVIIIIAIIFGINYIKGFGKEKIDNESNLLKCISESAVMYSQKSCPHCIKQKEILGNYTNLFIIIDCLEEPQKCANKKITGTPTWIVNNKKIEGVQSINQLKELTGC